MKHYRREGSEGAGTREIETREKLLNVALELFAARGFSGTSIRDIAKAMDMSISNIYHYFGSKEGILLYLFKSSSEHLLHKLQEKAVLDLPPLEKYILLLQTHVKFLAECQNESKLYTIDEEQLSEEVRSLSRKIQREILDLYVPTLEQLYEAGALRTRNLKIVAFSTFGVLNWMLRWYRVGGPLSVGEVCDEVVSFILHGCLVAGHGESG